MEINGVDLYSFSGVVVATVALVGGLKNFFPSWVKGKEPILSVILPIILSVGMKSTGGAFDEYGWFEVIILSIFEALTAGIVHDKILNPLVSRKSGSSPVDMAFDSDSDLNLNSKDKKEVDDGKVEG